MTPSIAPDTTPDIAHLTDMPQWFEQAFDVPRTEHSVDVGGTNIAYFKWGDSSLPGVVMTHGFMSHARCWAFIAPLLAENYCLVALDFSGMGDSGWRETYTVEMRVEEVLAVAADAGLLDAERKPTLVCHSYGCAVGLSAVEEQAGVWGGLILCEMSLLAPDEEPADVINQAPSRNSIRSHRVYSTFETACKKFRLTPDQTCSNKYLMDYLSFHSLIEVDGGWQWKFDPTILEPDETQDRDWWQQIAPRFTRLKLPRAVIHGQDSGMVSKAAVAYLKGATSGAVPVVSIHDAHHHLMLDQPLALAASLDSLLHGISA